MYLFTVNFSGHEIKIVVVVVCFFVSSSIQCHNGHLGDNAFFPTNPMDSFSVIIKRDKIHIFGFCKHPVYRISLSLSLSKNNYFYV